MAAYDLLLVNAHREYKASVAGDINIGINLLTVFLREKGYRVNLFRGFAHEAEEWIGATMAQGGARSIGFYCDYENITLVTSFSRMVKAQWGIPVFVGGPQATGIDEDFLTQSGCDAVVRGDGEYALLELLRDYLGGARKREEIEGLTFLDGEGRLIITPDRQVIEDLDALPWPDFRLEQDHDTWNVIPIMTGRGCPYRCAFCYEGYNSQLVRFRSVQNVLDEIAAHLERHRQCRYISFIDDTFTLQPERVEAFCRGLAEMRKQRDFVWFCEGHVQTLHKWPHVMKQMADAGLVKLFIGIESGSDKVLGCYRKQTNRRMIEEVVREAVKVGIPQITGNIIVGGPLESAETLEEDFDLIRRLSEAAPGRFESVGFFLMPFPNTAITREPARFGIRFLREREAHALEDIPLSETDEIPWTEMFKARNQLNRRIVDRMHRLYGQGEVPHETILTIYRLFYQYRVYSRWLMNIFSAYPIKHRYYQLLAQAGARRSAEIPSGELHRWHPQRVFHLWSTLSYTQGYPQLDGFVLSPLEHELLQLCSGKLTRGEVVDRGYEVFGERFENRDDFETMADLILRSFEERFWMIYAPM
ncbi:radical SAM protein [Heliobacterium undosum]|uniref:Radical SAM protein n=1 Tax=Heliomicrobium undosum TaxID=121734 RepID=A0A845L5T4_9FIRM|nr:radical SAM protein [Heliomicrobium undosum]MZP30589.1 radical SAM protein [Heliomicrobium undosum]